MHRPSSTRLPDPFRAVLAGLVAALALTLPVATVRAEPAMARTADAAQPVAGHDVAAADTGAPRSAAGKAIDAVRSAAQSAGNIFSRVPCASSRKLKFEISLPNVARKLAGHAPITIVAFGSSSTSSHGASSPAFQYPNRLADQLRRHYRDADITVVNKGVGGEDTPEMVKRLQSSVIDLHPDLVIWQLGTNTIVHGGDIEATRGLLEDGIRRLQAIGTDIVLVDPQYVPATMAKEAETNRMVSLIGRAARAMKVGVFPRFEVMKEWHTEQALPFDDFVIKDGLHMNDWGYACFAQLLGDSIIQSVDAVKAGASPEQQPAVLTLRPL
jgi:lysophospholipase L1-like esterase